jgi:alpha-L-fucosidase
MSAEADWKELGYGLFLHFGPGTLSGVSIGDGTFAAEAFDIEPDVEQWADVAVEAGMRYAVLTAKHVDGFCLWPSNATDYRVRHTDVAGRFVEAFRSRGLKVGFYYALWDRHCPFYEDDDAYAAYMREQIGELLTGYGEIVELWFDGGWDKDHPTRDWPFDPAWTDYGRGERWEWRKLYDHAHSLQPNCLVIQNSSSGRPGQIPYPPADGRTVERLNFVTNERLCEPVLEPEGLPIEFCESLTPDWFWKENESFPHPSAETIAGWRRTANAAGGNLLLNVGPNRQGRLPDYNVRFLMEARRVFEAGQKSQV